MDSMVSESPLLTLGADADGDTMLGPSEPVYVLQEISGRREQRQAVLTESMRSWTIPSVCGVEEGVMTVEKRRRTRAPVQFDVTAEVGRETFSMGTENISLSGILCRPDQRLKAGEDAKIQIVLSSEAIINARATIVRSDDEGIAIAFNSVDDDGFFHLKQIVQHNVDDADLIDKELAAAVF
jgi:hypothetical protein